MLTFIQKITIALLVASELLLTACGGARDGGQNVRSTTLLAVTVNNNIVVFSGLRANYTITPTTSGFAVTDNVGAQGTRNVLGNARLRFADGSLALDLEGTAGQAYRVYQAAFGRVPDLAGLSFWIGAMDQGVSLQDVASGFASSAEFQTVYGASPSNDDIIDKLYQNVLHRKGESAGVSYWLSILNNKLASRAAVLAAFSESSENKAGVLAAIAQGIVFTEPGVMYAPVARAGAAQTVVIGTVASLDGTASSDARGAVLTYAWTLTSRPAGSSATLNSATASRPTLRADLVGTYVATLTVNNGNLDSAPSSVTITVTAAPQTTGSIYRSEPTAGTKDDALAMLNRQGASGYAYLGPYAVVNPSSIIELFQSGPLNTQYQYELVASTALSATDRLASLNAEGAKGYLYKSTILFGTDYAHYYDLFLKSSARNTTYTYRLIAETFSLDALNSNGAEGYAYRGQLFLGGTTYTLYCKDAGAGASYSYLTTPVHATRDVLLAELNQKGSQFYAYLGPMVTGSSAVSLYMKSSVNSTVYAYIDGGEVPGAAQPLLDFLNQHSDQGYTFWGSQYIGGAVASIFYQGPPIAPPLLGPTFP